MGLINKIKNILFEEEEVEIPIIEKHEQPKKVSHEYKELPKKEAPINNDINFYSSNDDIKIENIIKEEPTVKEPVREIKDSSFKEEKPKTEPTFNFPDFNEEEFENLTPRKRSTNILEYERKRNEKSREKVEYKRSDRVTYRQEEVRETKPKFRPSPIISPVYGILDKNYTPDDITSRKEKENYKTLDVDSVRKKAFGIKETTEVKQAINPKDNVPKMRSSEIENREVESEKSRTIDELLEDSSDVVIKVREEINENKALAKDDHPTKNEDMIPPVNNSPKAEETLESDLFDLIDSMYENREGGE